MTTSSRKVGGSSVGRSSGGSLNWPSTLFEILLSELTLLLLIYCIDFEKWTHCLIGLVTVSLHGIHQAIKRRT